MFNCKMCKRNVEGEPARTNGVGVFCAECNSKIVKKSIETAKAKKIINGYFVCIWCGLKLANQNEQGRGCVCEKCEAMRNWLLKCMHVSDRPAKYVARREINAAISREKIKKSVEVREQTTDERIEKLEMLISILLESKNGVR